MIQNLIGGISDRAYQTTFTPATNANLVDTEFTISGVDIPTDTIKGFCIRANFTESISSAVKGTINFLRAIKAGQREYIDFVYVFRYTSGGTQEGYTADNSSDNGYSYSYQFDREAGTIKLILHKSTFNKTDSDVTYSNMFLKAAEYSLVVWW